MSDDRDLTDAEKAYQDDTELQAKVDDAREHPDRHPRPRTGMVRGPGDRSGTKK